MYASLKKLVRLLPNALPGKTRMAHWLLDRYLDRGESDVWDSNGFRYRVPDLREPIAFYLLANGGYEPELLKFILSRLKPGGVFVDVGANVGVFTLPVASHVGKTGKVLAIEASERVFPLLELNVKNAALDNVVCQRAAVCDRVGEVEFYDAPASKFGMGSMANRFEGKPVRVAGKTLMHLLNDAGLQSVDIIKVDVEGFESSVFEGAAPLLLGLNPPIVVFEFCDWAERSASTGGIGRAQRFLMDNGFSIWTLDRYGSGGRPLGEPVTDGFLTLIAERKSGRD